MRISVDESDPGHALYKRLRDSGVIIRVSVDGVQQMHCLMADDELGTVIRYKAVAEGLLVVEDDSLVDEIITGKVEFTLTDESGNPVVIPRVRKGTPGTLTVRFI